MGRIEYWLLGAVGALIVFIALASAKASLQPRRYALQVEQTGQSRDVDQAVSAPSSDTAAAADVTATPASVDVHSAVSRSHAPAPVRNVAEIRRRLADGASRTYVLDLLASQDSVLFRWPDSQLRVWIQPNPHIRDWWIGYVESARDVFSEWQTAGIPLRFSFPVDSTDADITVRWIEQFPPNELRIGLTRRRADQNAWITHADVIVALHDNDGDTFPPGEISEILRHEIGHALGLGHARNKGMIMYPDATQLDITETDKETLHLMYTVPPGKVR